MTAPWLSAKIRLLKLILAQNGGAFDLKSKGSLEVHFELFWALVAKWLPDGFWRLILSCSGLWWPMAPRWPLEAHFELFWAPVAKWLPDGL